MGNRFVEFLKKTYCYVLTALRLVGLCSILVVVLAFGCYFLHTSSDEEEVYRLPSPDGELNAIVLRETPRFLGKTVYHLYIVKAGQHLDTTIYQKVHRYHYFSSPGLHLANLVWVEDRLLQLGRQASEPIDCFKPKGFICHMANGNHHRAVVELASISSDGRNTSMESASATPTVIPGPEDSW